MANANLNLVTTSNTFSDWLNLTDNEANSINELRNGNYYKDNGNFTVANGSILIITPSGTTLSVTANASIAGYLTAGNLSITQNLSVSGGCNVANINVAGTSNTTFLSVVNTANVALVNVATLQAPSLSNQNILSVQIYSPANTSAQLVLGANGETVNSNTTGSGNTFRIQNHWDGNVYIDLNNTVQGDMIFRTGGTNILLRLDLGGNVNTVGNVQATGNITATAGVNVANINVSSTANTLNLVSSNIKSLNLTTTNSNVTTENATNFGTFANGGVVIAGVANLNFNNTATVNVSVTSNGTNQSNVAFTTNVSAIANLTAGGANTYVQFNDNQALQGSANVIYNKANGQMVVNNETIVANLTFATGANATQPTLASTREALTNAATINSPNTYTLNIANTNNFDITLGNTQFNSCNLSFANWANSGNLQTVTVILRQPGPNGNTSQTSSNVATWTNANVLWSNGEVPVLAGFKGKADILTFVTVDGGAHILGAHSMANIG